MNGGVCLTFQSLNGLFVADEFHAPFKYVERPRITFTFAENKRATFEPEHLGFVENLRLAVRRQRADRHECLYDPFKTCF